MSDKTKAAPHGRQCSTENKEHTQITRVRAGGQSLSELHNHNSVLVGFSSNRGEVSKTYIRQWRTLGHTAKNYPDIGWYHSLSASLACLRWRRLISPLAAVMRKPAVLSPSFFTESISSSTSCGTRTFTCFDLLFIEPVAITGSPCFKCYSLYAKKNYIQCLTCYSPSNKVNSTLLKARCKNGNASDCWTSTEASNQTVIRGNDHG